MKARILPVTLILFFMLRLLPATGAAGAGSGKNVIQANADATLDITQPKSPRLVGDRLPLRIEITSLSNDKIYVESVRAEFPEELLQSRMKLDADKEFFFKPVTDDETELDLGEVFHHTFEFPQESFNWRHPVEQWGLLTFKGGKHTVKIIANVTTGVGETPQRIEKTVEIEFLPAPGALVLGGLTGSLLLVLFERLYRLSGRLSRPDWPRRDDGGIDWKRICRAISAWFFSEGPSGIVQVLLGGFSVVLLLILVGLGQAKDLPISLKVDGFTSALGVGLFMHLLVVSLYKKLVLAAPPATGDPAAPAAVPPVPPV